MRSDPARLIREQLQSVRVGGWREYALHGAYVSSPVKIYVLPKLKATDSRVPPLIGQHHPITTRDDLTLVTLQLDGVLVHNSLYLLRAIGYSHCILACPCKRHILCIGGARWRPDVDCAWLTLTMGLTSYSSQYTTLCSI